MKKDPKKGSFMSSAYWNQWDKIEIESMHDMHDESDVDCCVEDSEITDCDDDGDDELVEYRYTTWEAI